MGSLPRPLPQPPLPSTSLGRARGGTFSVVYLYVTKERNHSGSLKPLTTHLLFQKNSCLDFLPPSQNEKQRLLGAEGAGLGPQPHHVLPPPALETTGHVSSSKARESALTLWIFPECLGGGWEIRQWGGEIIIIILKHRISHEQSTPRSPGRWCGDGWDRLAPCSLSSNKRQVFHVPITFVLRRRRRMRRSSRRRKETVLCYTLIVRETQNG